MFDTDINFGYQYINVSLDIDIINIKRYLFGHSMFRHFDGVLSLFGNSLWSALLVMNWK